MKFSVPKLNRTSVSGVLMGLAALAVAFLSGFAQTTDAWVMGGFGSTSNLGN